MPPEGGQLSSAVHIPEDDHAIASAGGHALAVWSKCHGTYFATAHWQRCQQTPFAHVPDFYGRIGAGARQAPAIGSKSNAVNPAFMTRERGTLLTRLDIPHFDAAIEAAG